MTIPISRYIARLNGLISTARDELTADCCRAEMACYLVRQGHIDEAITSMSEFRSRHFARPHALTSIWLNIFEGMIHLYGAGGTQNARDRFRRANAVAIASRANELVAISAAWLAHLAYLAVDLKQMVDLLRLVENTTSEDNHLALSRACLVRAQALHVAARYDLAMPWYEKSRTHALACEDDSAMSALMYNRASITVGHYKQLKLAGYGDQMLGRYSKATVDSVMNYDRLIGNIGLGAYVPLLQGQIASLDGRIDIALDIYDREIEGAVKNQGQSRVESYLLADRAYCNASLNRLERARLDVETAAQAIDEFTQIDDRAATYSRISQVYSILGKMDISSCYSELARVSWIEFVQLQQRFVEILLPLPGDV